jgi:hypothetical protein
MNHFDLLPDELMQLIAMQLPPKQIVRCARVCKRFYTIFMDEELWFNFLTVETMMADMRPRVGEVFRSQKSIHSQAHKLYFTQIGIYIAVKYIPQNPRTKGYDLGFKTASPKRFVFNPYCSFYALKATVCSSFGLVEENIMCRCNWWAIKPIAPGSGYAASILTVPDVMEKWEGECWKMGTLNHEIERLLLIELIQGKSCPKNAIQYFNRPDRVELMAKNKPTIIPYLELELLDVTFSIKDNVDYAAGVQQQDLHQSTGADAELKPVKEPEGPKYPKPEVRYTEEELLNEEEESDEDDEESEDEEGEMASLRAQQMRDSWITFMIGNRIVAMPPPYFNWK